MRVRVRVLRGRGVGCVISSGAQRSRGISWGTSIHGTRHPRDASTPPPASLSMTRTGRSRVLRGERAAFPHRSLDSSLRWNDGGKGLRGSCLRRNDEAGAASCVRVQRGERAAVPRRSLDSSLRWNERGQGVRGSCLRRNDGGKGLRAVSGFSAASERRSCTAPWIPAFAGTNGGKGSEVPASAGTTGTGPRFCPTDEQFCLHHQRGVRFD